MKQRKFVALFFLVVTTGVLLGNQSVNFGIERSNPEGNHVQVSSVFDITTDFTAEAWIYPTDLGNVADHQDIKDFGRTIFSSSTGSPASYPLLLMLKGTQFRLRTWQSPTTDQVYNSSITTNQWYHVAVTSTKGGTTTLYLDGVNVLSFTNAGTQTWNLPFTIGAIRPSRLGTNLTFAGRMDEVRVWNEVRTEEQINALMDYHIPGSYPGLIGNWDFEETTGTIAFDSSGSDNDGTYAKFSGSPWAAGKDDLITLPIELTSFTANFTVNNLVVLHWITQSETECQGYYIYRNSTDDLSTATLISQLIPANNTSEQQVYTYNDTEIFESGMYYYWLQNVDFNGGHSYHGPLTVNVGYAPGDDPIPGIPFVAGIKKIYPNPATINTIIKYGVEDSSPVSFEIYNTKGQLIRSFDQGLKDQGDFSLIWNGKDSQGSLCPSGIYLIRMQAGKQVSTAKVMLVR